MTSPKINELDAKYQTYIAAPTPENLTAVVEHLNPVINYNLSSINAGGNNLIRSKARLFTADAIKKYDPAFGASLNTWVSGQLMQLKRYNRQVNQPVAVADRVQVDAGALHRAEQDFMDKYDREPDLEELADHAKIPIKRIEKIRRSFRAMPSQSAIGEGYTQTETDFGNEALSYVYKDSDKVDRKIIEMKTGYGGRYEEMEPKDIAVLLGLTPSQLTRRSAKLSLKVQEIEQALQQVQ